jgi:hypothetical protein
LGGTTDIILVIIGMGGTTGYYISYSYSYYWKLFLEGRVIGGVPFPY